MKHFAENVSKSANPQWSGACAKIRHNPDQRRRGRPPPRTRLRSKVAFPKIFFKFFIFFLNLHCSTHGDEALVGRVTVNAID